MQLTVKGNQLLITDNIKSVEHFQNIKSKLDEMKTKSSSLVIHIIDSLSITSSVIGYLMKLTHKESIRITILAGDERLVHLLNDLGLTQEFNVKKA